MMQPAKIDMPAKMFFRNMRARVRLIHMTQIPPRLVELADWMNEALGRARERREEREASLQAQLHHLPILPVTKIRQNELHAELVREIEEDLKRF